MDNQIDDEAAHQAELWELIKDIRFAMFTYQRSDGRLHSYPVTTQNRDIDEQGTLYFFVSRGGNGADLPADGQVSVNYADPHKDRYVSVCGQVRKVDDTQTVQRLWSKMAEAWFPGGPTDPDLQLLKVRIDDAQYWNVTDSKITQMVKMTTAAITGKRPQGMGEHHEVKM